jgi:hypothetical protein
MLQERLGNDSDHHPALAAARRAHHFTDKARLASGAGKLLEGACKSHQIHRSCQALTPSMRSAEAYRQSGW